MLPAPKGFGELPLISFEFLSESFNMKLENASGNFSVDPANPSRKTLIGYNPSKVTRI